MPRNLGLCTDYAIASSSPLIFERQLLSIIYLCWRKCRAVGVKFHGCTGHGRWVSRWQSSRRCRWSGRIGGKSCMRMSGRWGGGGLGGRWGRSGGGRPCCSWLGGNLCRRLGRTEFAANAAALMHVFSIGAAPFCASCTAANTHPKRLNHTYASICSN